MLKRLLTGFTYMMILVAFFVMKIYVPVAWRDVFFDIPIYAFSIIGTGEMLRAFRYREKTDKEAGREVITHITRAQEIAAYAFAAVFTPLFAVMQIIFQFGAFTILFTLIAAVIIVWVAYAFGKESGATESGTCCAMVACAYPTGLLGFMLMANHLCTSADPSPASYISRFAILAIFITSPCSDSFAFLFGKGLGKYFPKKMAPTISPKKTVVGGIGGLIGGGVGAALLLLIFHAAVPSFLLLEGYSFTVNMIVAVVMGIVSAFITELGDLVESYFKRKIGIKDMGTILPGHGGIMDRIDGTMFTGLFIYIIMSVFIMI